MIRIILVIRSFQKILSLLGQKLNNTGSGIVAKEFIKEGEKHGDHHFLVNLEYQNNFNLEGSAMNRKIIFASENGEIADINHPILGMSDIMPYKSVKYSDFNYKEITKYLNKVELVLKSVIDKFNPDILHIHHLWIHTYLASKL